MKKWLLFLIFIAPAFHLQSLEHQPLVPQRSSCKKTLLKSMIALATLLNAIGTSSDIWAMQANLNSNSSATAPIAQTFSLLGQQASQCHQHAAGPITVQANMLNIPSCQSSYLINEAELAPNIVSLVSRLSLFIPLMIAACFSCSLR